MREKKEESRLWKNIARRRPVTIERRPPGQLGYNITAACFTASRRVRRFGLKFLDRRDGGPWENWRVGAGTNGQKIT